MFTPRAPETLISIRRLPTWLRNKRKASIRQGVPALMEAIAHSMRNGLAVSEAVRVSPEKVMNCPRALREEMGSVGLLMNAGSDIQSALQAVAARVDMPEFDLLVSCCSEHSEKGERSRHDVIISLDKVAAELRGRNETLGLMHSTERSAVLSGAVVGCVPFGTLLVCNMIFPGEMSRVSSSLVSQVMLALAFAFVMAGVAWICSLGRTEPGQTREEVHSIIRNMPRRMVSPLALCIVPALLLVGFAPFMAV